MTADAVADLALEWWRASGPRTRERLVALVEHYATIYRFSQTERELALAQATAQWEGKS